MTVRGALIGFGKIAESTHLPALAAEGFEVVAVVDPDPERLAAAQARGGVNAYRTLGEVLERERLDFVDICTPPYLHYEAARAALAAGLHVLCEKPLVLQLEHGLALGEQARRENRVVTCVHNWIYAPVLRRMASWVASGELGSLQEIELETLRTEPAAVAGAHENWRIDAAKAGGGILFDHGWHGMSILQRMVGQVPVSVRGHVRTTRFQTLSVEDTAQTEVSFEGGVRGRFEATWAASERSNRAVARLDQGIVTVVDDRLTVTRGDALLAQEKFSESLAGGGYRPSWTAGVVKAFRHEIEHPEARGSSLLEALRCLQLLLLTYESSRRAGISLPVERLAV